MKVTANEVLVLDTNTFISEIGLTSKDGSALKHYLYHREMQLVVPELVAKECERKLIDHAKGKRDVIQNNLRWLGKFCGGVNGWLGLNDTTISDRAKALAKADHIGAVIVPETDEVRRRAELRNQAERPPSHKKDEMADCRIWEQCLDLLTKCHIVFVSADDDFRGHRDPNVLHPELRNEADVVAEDRRLTFHQNIESLLLELRSEIKPLPNDVVFTFIYKEIASVIEELESNSGCQRKGVGEVKQTLFTTDQSEVIEVRIEITDKWESADKTKTMDFHFAGSCHYRLSEEKLCDLTPSDVRLLTQLPDGSIRAVDGSYVGLRGHLYGGPPPIYPEPTKLGA